MSDIREIVNKQLRQGELDLIDVVAIPQNGDRMVRLRTLEEALDDFHSNNSSETVSYLIQVKPSDGPMAAKKPSATTASPTGQNIYTPDGKLNVPYLTQNAEILFKAGEVLLARNVFKAIHDSGERTGMALFGIGRCNEAEGKLDEARANYEESIAYHPTLEIYHRLAALLTEQKKEQLAAEVFERALSLKDLDLTTRFELHKACGNCWTRAKVPASAEHHFKSALEVDPSADEIRSNLAALHLQQQNSGEAKRHFEDALASNPKNDRAEIGLASCYLAEGDKRQAHDHFAKALEINIQNPTAIYHLVKCAYDIRSYATAARVVEDYIEVAPVNPNLLYSLAGLQFHLGRGNDARHTANQILQMSPEHNGAKELIKLIDRFIQA
ncbi:tetratricopeptide repeat protein [Bdellovibrionota bacterium FG-1]